MFHVYEELEKLIMFESLECLEQRLSIVLNKFKNLMWVLSVDCSIFEKLEISIFRFLWNAKLPLPAQLSSEVLRRMFSIKWKEICMIAWEFPKIFILIPDLCQEEEPLKCNCQEA